MLWLSEAYILAGENYWPTPQDEWLNSNPFSLHFLHLLLALGWTVYVIRPCCYCCFFYFPYSFSTCLCVVFSPFIFLYYYAFLPSPVDFSLCEKQHYIRKLLRSSQFELSVLFSLLWLRSSPQIHKICMLLVGWMFIRPSFPFPNRFNRIIIW